MRSGGMSSHRSSLFAQQRSAATASGRPANQRNDRDMEMELQRENDQLVEGISVDMTRLKAAAQSIRDETSEQNRLLDTLQDAFQNARDGVKGTVGRLDGVMGRYGCRDTMTCAVVLFVALLLLYFFAKKYMSSSAAVAAGDK